MLIFMSIMIKEITQGADTNPALFLACLIEAVQKYTNLEITTPAGLLYLHIQFIIQSAPDIRHKLQQLEKGPETPQRDLLEIAFKVFDNREEEAKREKERTMPGPPNLGTPDASEPRAWPMGPSRSRVGGGQHIGREPLPRPPANPLRCDPTTGTEGKRTA